MEMKSRIRRIIEILIKENREYTAKELSLKLDVSEKTVRNEIAGYCENEEKSPVKIISLKRGYRIQDAKVDEEEIQQFLQRLDLAFGNELDREKYVLRKILLNERYVKLEELADELFISTPTIHRIFKNVKATLMNYKLEIISKPGYGVSVLGDEIDKRLCYVHCLPKASDENIETVAEQCGMKKEDFYYIDYAIRKSLDKNEFDLTETGIKNLTVHLMYAITRMREGSFIRSIRLNYCIPEKEANIAEELIKNLEEEYGIAFPPTEIDYVRVHLSSKNANLGNEAVAVSAETEAIIRHINDKIKNILGYDFLDDWELLTMLAMHIEPMLSRIKFGINIPNPVLEEIKAEFPNAYECAVIAADYIKENYRLTVSDDGLGYLSLHYNLAIDRLAADNTNKKILIVCGSGMSTARLMQAKIEKKFQIGRGNISLCSIRELRTKDLSGYDAVISSVKIPFPVDRKVTYIEDILGDFSIESSLSDRMLLQSYVDDRLFFFHQDFRGRDEIINFLCSKVNEVYGAGEEFARMVWKRENLSSTDIGNLVAIPHAFSMFTEHTIFALCTLKKAVKWKRRKVKYVFLVSFGKKDLEISHDLNEKLLSLLLDARWIALLDKVDDVEGLMGIL